MSCSTLSAGVTKKSDCFQRLSSCYHAASDWSKWPQGDREQMGTTVLRKGLLTSDMLFHTLFTFSLDCVQYQISVALPNGMGVPSSSKVRYSRMWTRQEDTSSHQDPADSSGVMLNFTSILKLQKSNLLAYRFSFQMGKKIQEEKALVTTCSFGDICHFFQQHPVMSGLLFLAKSWA